MSKQEPHLQVFTANRKHIGHFDGEFFYTNPEVDLRVDGDEVYTRDIPCEFVGYFKSNQIKRLDGTVLYYFEP